MERRQHRCRVQVGRQRVAHLHDSLRWCWCCGHISPAGHLHPPSMQRLLGPTKTGSREHGMAREREPQQREANRERIPTLQHASDRVATQSDVRKLETADVQRPRGRDRRDLGTSLRGCDRHEWRPDVVLRCGRGSHCESDAPRRITDPEATCHAAPVRQHPVVVSDHREPRRSSSSGVLLPAKDVAREEHAQRTAGTLTETPQVDHQPPRSVPRDARLVAHLTDQVAGAREAAAPPPSGSRGPPR